MLDIPKLASAYVSHPPIYIHGDADFTAANGVTGGSGTPADPFIIQGWEINASAATGIEVWNTTASFIVRGVFIHSGVLGSPNRRSGIAFYNLVNARVESSMVSRNSWGLEAVNVTAVRVERNTFDSNEGGLSVYASESVEVVQNVVLDNRGSGVRLVADDQVAMESNTFQGSCSVGGATWCAGLMIEYSTRVSARANGFTGEGIGLADTLHPFSVGFFDSHTITTDNSVNGKPVHYYKDCSDLVVDGLLLGQIIVADCENVSVANLGIADTDRGIQMYAVRNATIERNTLSRNLLGVFVVHSQKTTLRENRFDENEIGLWGHAMTNFSVVLNTVVNNTGAPLGAAWIQDSVGVVVANNTVEGSAGSGIAVMDTTDMAVTGNRFAQNSVGLDLGTGAEAVVHHNAFVGNQRHAVDGGSNLWDDGYPSGGNWWDNFTGPDFCSGPAQDSCPGPDGIGDITFIIDGDSRDRYPPYQGAIPLLPPRNLTATAVSNDIVLEWEPSPSLGVVQFEVYGGFLPYGVDFSTPLGEVDASDATWTHPGAANALGGFYYTVVAVDYAGRRSGNTNTAGKYTVDLAAGLHAVSLPLEPFEPQDTNRLRDQLKASQVAWLNAGYWDPGPGLVEMARGYLVSMPVATRVTHTGLPAAQVLYGWEEGFSAGSARLSASVNEAGDVALSWPIEPGATEYRVYSSPERKGFHDGVRNLVGTTSSTSLEAYGLAASSGLVYVLVVPVVGGLERGSTYSIGVAAVEVSGTDSFGIPFRLDSWPTVHDLLLTLPGALGIIWLAADGSWVPHHRGMPAGVYDAGVAWGIGYQIQVPGSVSLRFVGS